VTYLLDTNTCIRLLNDDRNDDVLIAAIALANNLILVTHNTQEFDRVAGLTLEDWELPLNGGPEL
jgi:predicted nucleic acid-binding protein